MPRLCGSAAPPYSAVARRERPAVLFCRLAALYHDGTDCSTTPSAEAIAGNPGQITVVAGRDRTQVI